MSQNRAIVGFYGGYCPLPKAKPSLAERIRRILAGGRSITGRGELQRELYPDGKWTLEDTADLNRTLNRMIQDGEIVETKTDLPGANEFPAVAEWSYRLGTGKPATDPNYYGLDVFD